MEKTIYEYMATVLRVVDGDTIVIDLDLGVDVHIKIRTRLVGIDAPELRTEAGKAAKAYMEKLLPVGTQIVCRTVKDRKEKFGRYLVNLELPAAEANVAPTNINQHMVDVGHAVVYNPR